MNVQTLIVGTLLEQKKIKGFYSIAVRRAYRSFVLDCQYHCQMNIDCTSIRICTISVTHRIR